MTLKGAFHHTPRHVRAALAFLGSGAYPFERLITHQVGLEGVRGAARRPAARLPQGRRRPRRRSSAGEQRQLGLALAAQDGEIDLDPTQATRLGERARLLDDLLRREDAADAAIPGSGRIRSR